MRTVQCLVVSDCREMAQQSKSESKLKKEIEKLQANVAELAKYNGELQV
jgi:cell division protein FtsB